MVFSQKIVLWTATPCKTICFLDVSEEHISDFFITSYILYKQANKMHFLCVFILQFMYNVSRHVCMVCTQLQIQ